MGRNACNNRAKWFREYDTIAIILKLKTFELNKIILKGENSVTEFKNSFNAQGIETIVAFANTKGGKIIIGVSDKRQIIGITVGFETLKNWQNEVKLKTEPSIIPDAEAFIIGDKTVAVLSINEFPIKPISLQGRYFKRVNNSNHQMSLQEVSDLYMKSIQASWDAYEYSNATIADLNLEKVIEFIRKVNDSGRFQLTGTPIEALEKLRMLKNGMPSNASMILFSNENLYFNVHVGRFKSTATIIDDRMIRGNLFDVQEETMRYIISQIKVAFEFTGQLQRNEIFEYPLRALRELVTNALIHRDYTSPIDIQIKIFDQGITIFNPGRLFGNLTIEDLRSDNYQAQTRNKLIAEAFYLTKEIEKYGSGFIGVREEIRNYPTMKFEYKEMANGFLVELSYTKQKTITKVEFGDNVGDNVGDNRLTEIIDLIKQNNKITAKQLAARLSVSDRTIERDIEKLKKQGKLKRIGNEKNGHWLVPELNP